MIAALPSSSVVSSTIRARHTCFCQAGVDGLLRDKTKPSRKPPLDEAVIAVWPG